MAHGREGKAYFILKGFRAQPWLTGSPSPRGPLSIGINPGAKDLNLWTRGRSIRDGCITSGSLLGGLERSPVVDRVPVQHCATSLIVSNDGLEVDYGVRHYLPQCVSESRSTVPHGMMARERTSAVQWRNPHRASVLLTLTPESHYFHSILLDPSQNPSTLLAIAPSPSTSNPYLSSIKSTKHLMILSTTHGGITRLPLLPGLQTQRHRGDRLAPRQSSRTPGRGPAGGSYRSPVHYFLAPRFSPHLLRLAPYIEQNGGTPSAHWYLARL
jgi:hypothetical protein